MKKMDFSTMERAELEQRLMDAETDIAALEMKVKQYEEMIRSMKRKEYGRKSETVDSDQLDLFNEIEKEADPSKNEPTIQKVHPETKNKKKRKPKEKGARDAMLEPIDKEIVECTLSEEEQICPECGEKMHDMKKTVQRTIEITPPKVTVKETVIHSYSCRNCEKTGVSVPIVTADHPHLLLPKSLASPSSVSYILGRKFENRDPLNKISQDLKTQGLILSRQDLSNWVIKVAERYLFPVCGKMKETLLGQKILHADETPLLVLHEPVKPDTGKCYMWVFCSQQPREGGPTPIVLYEYDPRRARTVAQDFLTGYQGYVQSDGYSVYQDLGEGITNVGCMVHVRRKYLDAIKAMKGKADKYQEAGKGFRYADLLTRMGEHCKRLPAEKRRAYKNGRLRRVLENFFAWAKNELEKPTTTKGTLRTALVYTVNQKEFLRNYLLDDDLEISNNRAERMIKPFVMGRKNWLFCNTPRGANASAAAYSIVQTAKENGLDAYKYIEWMLGILKESWTDDSQLDPDAIDAVMPWTEAAKENCAIAN